jgi:hypothetical protein
MRTLVNLLTPEQQWGAQLAASAVGGIALGRLLVELGRGGVATLARRYRMRGGTR